MAQDTDRTADDPDRTADDPDRTADDPDRTADDPDRAADDPDRAADDPDRTADDPDRTADDLDRRPGELRRTVRDLLLHAFLADGDPRRLADDTSLERSHIVDSTAMMELIVLLERTFSIHVAIEDAVPENLDSVNAIVAYVARKLRQP